MICRFCGKKTENYMKCDYCLKDSPFLSEYRSYRNDTITDRLASLIELSSEDVPDNLLKIPVPEPEEVPAEIPVISEPVPEIEQEVKQVIPEPEPEKVPAYVPERNSFLKRKRNIIGIIGVAVVMGVCFFINKAPEINSGLTGKLSDEKITTVANATLPATTTTGTTAGNTATGTSTAVTSSGTSATTTVTRPALKSAGIMTDIPENKPDMSIRGKYYSISDSVFSNNNSSEFINIFGTRPVECPDYMYLKDDSMEYNKKDYKFTYSDNTVTFEDTDFAGIGEDFLDTFNFNEITQGNDFDNSDNKENELFVFQVKKEKDVDAVILCNKLKGLSYDDVRRTADFSGEGIVFSISNEGKDSVFLYKDHRIDVSLKTAYRDNAVDIADSIGEIIVSRYGEGYDIVRISPDGEHYFYFYRKYDDPDVYMIQYVKYNTSESSVQHAVLRD